MTTAVLIGAGDRGARAYAPYALTHPNELQIVAVAEPDQSRREALAQRFGIKEAYVFTDWRELLGKARLADAALVCTQDSQHFEPAMAAMDAGYHTLLEKPMSNDPAECFRLGEKSKNVARTLTVCHVLRYTPFFSMIKQIIDEGRVGELATIQLNESLGYWHMAHSYVRGNWRNSRTSSPMILSKSSHDMDILLWLANSDCTSVTSFGSLLHFHKGNAPEGAPERCLDGCPIADTCPYYAPRIYRNGDTSWPASVVSADPSPEARLRALRDGPYGRCVYRCDNNVVDHQVVNAQFDNQVTASFTLSGFTEHNTRTIRITGTEGEIHGHLERGEIMVHRFSAKHVETLQITEKTMGHSGGDKGIMRDFVRVVGNNHVKPSASLTSAEVSVQSHLMAFAAEESRRNGSVVHMPSYREQLSISAEVS